MSKVIGTVNALGQKQSGDGFTVTPVAGGQTGGWTVTLNDPFKNTAATLVSLINAEITYSYRLRSQSGGSFDIESYSDNGGSGYTPAAASFCFSVWGDR